VSYFPTKEADFVEWSANLIAVSKENAVEWALPTDQITGLEALHNEFKALHEKCVTAAWTKLDMQAKNEKKKILIKREEVFVRNNLQNNDRMTDSGRKSLRIPIYATIPTSQSAPATIPYVEVQMPAPRTLRIRFRAETAKRWGKPPHVHGIECLWIIADKAPAKIEDLIHSSFATRNPLDLTFDEDQRGKRFWFAARWENGAVQKGRWSDIFNAIIP
jgi:hypothetical protein